MSTASGAGMPRGRLKQSYDFIKEVVLKTGRDHLSVVSAGCAYYALFAIFPALTASISLYGLTANPENVERQFTIFKTVLPPQAYAIVLDQIKRIAETSGQTLGWGFAVGLFIALWSANHATQAMFSALNIAYGQPERRGIVHFYLAAIGYTFVGIVGVAAMLFAIISVPILFADSGHPHIFETLITYLRWPMFFVLTLFMLALVYRFGPSHEDPQWRWITPGSIFATTVWLLASLGFSYYVSNFADYDKMYGSLGAVIILLFWLYISFYIVLLGAEINAALEKEAET
ncbi:MAG: YihY/virulence factor BrkB family protein [Methyloceanibacter sp.]|jgi:membrane protein